MNNFNDVTVVEEDPFEQSKVSSESEYWSQSKANSELFNIDGQLNDNVPHFGRATDIEKKRSVVNQSDTESSERDDEDLP